MRFILLALLATGATCAAPIDIEPSQFESISEQGPYRFYFHPGREASLPRRLSSLLLNMEHRGLLKEAKLIDESTFTELLNEESSEVRYRIVGLSEAKQKGSLLSFFGLTELPRFQIELFRRPQDFSQNGLGLFKQTAAIHTLLLMVGQYLSDRLNALSPAVLAAYFYQYFGNFESILDLKSKGKVLVLREDELALEVSPYYIALTNLAEELTINGAIAGTLPQVEGFPLKDVLAASSSFGLAKVSIDKHVADLQAEKQRASRNGDEIEVKALSRRQSVIQSLFFNGVVPALRGALLATKNSSYEPLCEAVVTTAMGMVGCHAIYKEYRRIQALKKIPNRFRGKECAQALLLTN